MRFSRPGVLLAAFALCLFTAAWAEVPVPPLQARVTDQTGTLSSAQRSALESQLQGIEARSGSQIAVLLVATTQPEAIEQYSMRVAEAWKLGKKGVDNGLLLLVAKNDRKARIEVGYGLEGVIPDAIARRVIDENMTPLFKQGDFAGGLSAGAQRLGALIEGSRQADKPVDHTLATPGVGALPLPPAPQDLGEQVVGGVSELPVWLWVALLVLGTALRWIFGPLFGGLAAGGAVGGGAWLISGSLGVGLFAGLLAFVFVLVGLANWLAMGLSGSSSCGGGGGFSGGGGGFGGGGASGSW